MIKMQNIYPCAGMRIRQFFSTDPDPAQLVKYSGAGSDSGSDLKSK